MNTQSSPKPTQSTESSPSSDTSRENHSNIDNGSDVLQFIQTGRGYSRSSVQYTVEARGVEYSVDMAIPKTKKTFSKIIVGPLSFKISPGSMMAIIGPSGAGKSTLLDILAGRIPANKYKGNVLMNSYHSSNRLQRKIGYVMQSDKLYPMLTVRETLYFAAQLRLRGITHKDLKNLVDITLDLLHLSSVANSYIGNGQIRGISGGERRRCTIGVDIIHQVRCCIYTIM